MVHRDTAALVDTICEYVEGEQEFRLGISDGQVFESTDPSKAAISAVVGTLPE